MNQPDPRLPLNCPTCGESLQYVATKVEPARTYLYSCPTDGFFELTDDHFARVVGFNPKSR
jgi:hypothetical protein